MKESAENFGASRSAAGLSWLGWVILAAALLGGSGCARTHHQQQIQQLDQRLQSMQTQLVRYDDRLEDLSHRLFVLSDRVQTAQEEITAPPNLEVVRLDPGPAPPPPTPEMVEAPRVLDLSTSDSSEPPVQLTLHGVKEKKSNKNRSLKDIPPEVIARRAEGDRLFSQALGLYRAGKSDAAHRAFAAYLERFPVHRHADNAVYWMGECRFEQGAYRKAITEFEAVLKRYPRTTKKPETLLKLGLAYERLNELSSARAMLRDVVRSFPNTAAADLARTRLASKPLVDPKKPKAKL